MRRHLVLLFALGIAACQDMTQPPGTATGPAADVAPPAAVQSGRDRVVAGEVIVKLRDGANAADVARAHGLALGRSGYRDAFTVLRGAAGAERANASALARDARVVYAEPNYLRQTSTFDTRLWAYFNPGGLTIKFTRGRNSGQVVTSDLSKADADEDNIEGYASGGSPVVIGSIDTGVQFDHTEFSGVNLIAGRDWYSGDDDPSDEDGHGTHTTGTMAGRTVGVAGVSGAGPNVSVYVQRVCGPQGCPTSAIVNAINAAADFLSSGSHIVAVNMSLGGASESQAEHDAIQHATDNGVLVIASAGNGGTGTVSCPACDANAISVAATNWRDTLTYYSNWGGGLDISAPGGEMFSNTTEESGIYSSYLGGGYAYLQGTSMAAPQVTGAAGVVASVTGLRGSALRTRILGSADDLHDANHFGAGRLNTYRAVTNTTLSAAADQVNGGGTTNAPPTAAFTSSCSGLTCSFTDGSSDSDGSISARSWSFGDGVGSAATNPSHTYASGGTYTVTLTVTDNGGATGSISHDVAVSAGSGGGDVIVLGVTQSNKGPNVFAELAWTGASAANVDIYRGLNSATPSLLTTTSNTGSFSDKLGRSFTGTVQYKVCDAGTAVCSSLAGF